MKIELRAACKKYGAVSALDKVSFTAEPGQLVAVLGANGAGKTTLLRCLAGIAAPDGGAIYYDEQEFHRGRLDLRRRLHFLPDFPFFFHDYSTLQHLGLVLRIYETDGTGIEDRVIELLRDFDLLPIADKLLPTLSRGQAYKAGLVTLMAVDPELWLLDEPFASGMDPHGIDAFKTRAREATRRGRTVVYSTQLLDIAERFADRVCVIHQGELRAFATLEELRSQVSGAGGTLEQLFRQLRSEGR